MQKKDDSFDVEFRPDSGLETRIPRKADKRPGDDDRPPHCGMIWAVPGEHDDKKNVKKPPQQPQQPPRKKPGPGKKT